MLGESEGVREGVGVNMIKHIVDMYEMVKVF